MIELRTQRLLIRDPIPGDLEGWHKLKSDAQNMRFVEQLQTSTLQESSDDLQCAITAAIQSCRDTYFFTLIRIQTGEFMGNIGFKTEPVPEGLRAGVGWFLLPEHHGRGYAAEAFRALIPFMFNTCGVAIIDAGCNAANHASERVMQKSGMLKVREYENGTRLQYQLTKQDYEILIKQKQAWAIKERT